MDMLASSLTLIVKTPNQQIDDQKIEVQYEWTVKQLKKHLSEVYPSRPQEQNQKLIYSGKLLQDRLTLKEIIRVNDECDIHTVHLVCAAPCPNNQSGDDPTPTESAVGDSSPAPVISSTPTVTDQQNNEDNLRQRFHHSQSEPQLYHNQMGYNYYQPPQQQQHMAAYHQAQQQQQQYLQQQYQYQQQQQQQMYQHASPYHMHMHQQAWMMHSMYAQRMAEYMQQHHHIQPNNHAGVNNAPLQFSPPGAHQQQPAPEQGGPGVAAPPPVQQNNQQQQNVRMNAGFGGAVMDDNEDELMNRDWLDWVHTICRFGVLVSIVYFYSSFMRFALVLGCVFLLYLYNGGWLRIHRFAGRNNNNNNAVRPPIDPVLRPPAPAENEPNIPQTDPSSDEMESPLDDTQSEIEGDLDDTPSPMTPPPQPTTDVTDNETQPGIVVTIWAFVSSFFSSIIPTQPPAL